MSRQISLESPFNTNYFQEYYTGYRNRIDDLFPSEKHFLGKVVAESDDLLDVGCASGGMYKIMTTMKPSLHYTGIDIAASLVETARKQYPGVSFHVGDGVTLPFQDNSFNSVVSFGTTVHDQDYEKLIRDCYRVTRQYFLFDIRLVTDDLASINNITKGYVLDGVGFKYPYNVVNSSAFFSFLRSLEPARVQIFGYWGKANEFTHLPVGYEKLCMCGVLVEKRQDEIHEIVFEIDLPFTI
jgi:ubiquinone/menaquinone biosynthesis C-methylase UbiE